MDNQNLQRLSQGTEERQEARSDKEAVRLKEDLKLETGRVRSLSADEYHTQL